jgi:ketosteroid isomerase-like protein
MSADDVEAVRRGYEAFNSGDIESLLEGLDPEIVWNVPPILPEKSVYEGLEGVTELLHTWRDTFDDFQLVVEEIIDAGGRVVVMAAVRGRGKGSGIDVESPSFGWVWTLRHGKLLRVEVFPNRAETFAAVGLEE